MSFRLKLVAYFLLVSLLPLGAAGWALHAVSGRSETRRVDVRLEAGLRAVPAGYKDELSSAGRRANQLASSSSFQQALQRGDRRTLRRLLAGSPGLRLESPTLTLGPTKTIGAGTKIAVVSHKGLLGTPRCGRAPQLSVARGLARGERVFRVATCSWCSNTDVLQPGPQVSSAGRLSAPSQARTLLVGGRSLPRPRRQPAARIGHGSPCSRRSRGSTTPSAPLTAAS